MRTAAVLLLLLLGCLQAAIAPATAPSAPGGPLRIQDGPFAATQVPAENPTAVRRQNDTSRQSALQGDGKSQKCVLAVAPGLVPARGSSAARLDVAGPVAVESVRLRPNKPRAPPSVPSFQ